MISFSSCSIKPFQFPKSKSLQKNAFPSYYSCTPEAHLEFIIKVGESAVLFRPDEEEGTFQFADPAAGEDGKGTALFDGEVFGDGTS
jgi:hypothetical protein